MMRLYVQGKCGQQIPLETGDSMRMMYGDICMGSPNGSERRQRSSGAEAGPLALHGHFPYIVEQRKCG